MNRRQTKDAVRDENQHVQPTKKTKTLALHQTKAKALKIKCKIHVVEQGLEAQVLPLQKTKVGGRPTIQWQMAKIKLMMDKLTHLQQMAKTRAISSPRIVAHLNLLHKIILINKSILLLNP